MFYHGSTISAQGAKPFPHPIVLKRYSAGGPISDGLKVKQLPNHILGLRLKQFLGTIDAENLGELADALQEGWGHILGELSLKVRIIFVGLLVVSCLPFLLEGPVGNKQLVCLLLCDGLRQRALEMAFQDFKLVGRISSDSAKDLLKLGVRNRSRLLLVELRSGALYLSDEFLNLKPVFAVHHRCEEVSVSSGNIRPSQYQEAIGCLLTYAAHTLRQTGRMIRVRAIYEIPPICKGYSIWR